MQRFNNILVVYAMIPGDEDTLDRAARLARRNGAQLTILNVFDGGTGLQERERMMDRLAQAVVLPHGNASAVVRWGGKAEQILAQIDDARHDLVILTGESMTALGSLFGTDVALNLMRQAPCPVWVSRPNGNRSGYRRIVAALDASNADPHLSDINARVLQMASSLAVIEQAELDIFYAWDFSALERDTVTSELTPVQYSEQVDRAHFAALERLMAEIERVLGKAPTAHPVVARGDVVDRLHDYLRTYPIDLLVMGESRSGPIATAFLGNSANRLLADAPCPVLLAKPSLFEKKGGRTSSAA